MSRNDTVTSARPAESTRQEHRQTAAFTPRWEPCLYCRKEAAMRTSTSPICDACTQSLAACFHVNMLSLD